MSIPHPTTSFRMPIAVKDALNLMCRRRGYGHPGTWLARVSEEQLVVELGMELLENVGFWDAYKALESTTWDYEESPENAQHDVLHMLSSAKAFYTEAEVAVFQHRLKGLLKAVGFVEVGRRIRHGLMQSYRRHAETARTDNVQFCKHGDPGGSHGKF